MNIQKKLSLVLTLVGVKVKFKTWGPSNPLNGNFDIFDNELTIKEAYISDTMILINFIEDPKFIINVDIVKVPIGDEYVDLDSYLISIDKEDIDTTIKEEVNNVS
jgi:hypothetical protein